MKGDPNVMWTCDRCGNSTQTPPSQTLPTGWFEIPKPQLRSGPKDEGQTCQLCESCRVRLRRWIDAGEPEADSRG